jgi:hypothetical protein
MSWQWAEQVLRQLLKCAVAARLMRALPGGCVPAAVALDQEYSSNGSSSSSAVSTSVVAAERLICASVTASAGYLFEAARRQHNATKGKGEDEMQESFASQPAVAEVALQLLASCCLLLHKPLTQWQQQQQREVMLRQQSRHMRRDVLLLLPSDLQQHLAQLLPPGVMIDVIAADPTAGHTSNGMPAGEQDVLDGVSMLVSVLHLHVKSIAESSSDGSISSPALSAAALQLGAVLLLLGAAEWQRQWCALTVQQQELLKTETAVLDEADVIEVNTVRQQLAPARAILDQSRQLLQQQTRVLWKDGQWQPQMQLLQQGGGEVLLQGLTLAVQCVSLDQPHRGFKHAHRLLSLLEVLLPGVGAWTCAAWVNAFA